MRFHACWFHPRAVSLHCQVSMLHAAASLSALLLHIIMVNAYNRFREQGQGILALSASGCKLGNQYLQIYINTVLCPGKLHSVTKPVFWVFLSRAPTPQDFQQPLYLSCIVYFYGINIINRLFPRFQDTVAPRDLFSPRMFSCSLAVSFWSKWVALRPAAQLSFWDLPSLLCWMGSIVRKANLL